jgi:hypothetical protein
LLRAHEETDSKYEELVTALRNQMENGKAEIWDCHKQVVSEQLILGEGGISTNTTSAQVGVGRNENLNLQQLPQQEQQESSAKINLNGTTVATATTKPNLMSAAADVTEDGIYIEIMGGDYAGSSFVLRPTPKGACWVGRSSGKKFREKGISVPRDLEVSTTHGKFEFKRGKYYYTDSGSTNGSKIVDKELVPDSPFELENGTEVTVGQTIMKVTLL